MCSRIRSVDSSIGFRLCLTELCRHGMNLGFRVWEGDAVDTCLFGGLTCLFMEAYLLKYYILYGFYTFLPQRSFLYIIWALTLLILEMGVLVRNWITEITELFFSNLSNPEGGSEIRDSSESFL